MDAPKEPYKVIYLQHYEWPEMTWCQDRIDSDGHKDWVYHHESELIAQRDAAEERYQHMVQEFNQELSRVEELHRRRVKQLESQIEALSIALMNYHSMDATIRVEIDGRE